MNSQEYRNLQEAYLDVYQEEVLMKVLVVQLEVSLVKERTRGTKTRK